MDKSSGDNTEKVKITQEMYYLQMARELSSLLKNSSGYWKDTISNMGNNFCNCNRPEVIEDDYIMIDNQVKLDNILLEDLHKDKIIIEHLGENETENKNESNSHPSEKKIDSRDINQSAHAAIFSSPDQNVPNYNRKSWTENDDKMLLEYVNQTKTKNWKKISQIIKTKTPQQCSYRYNKLISNLTRKKWNRNEDFMLIELIEIFGKNWEEVTKRLPGRSHEEIIERFEKKLDPKLKRSKFEKEEDDMILKLYEQYGNKWNEMAKYFENRSANMIKNRYYSVLKKKYPRHHRNSQTSNNSETKSFMSSTFNNFGKINRNNADDFSQVEFQNKYTLNNQSHNTMSAYTEGGSLYNFGESHFPNCNQDLNSDPNTQDYQPSCEELSMKLDSDFNSDTFFNHDLDQMLNKDKNYLGDIITNYIDNSNCNLRKYLKIGSREINFKREKSFEHNYNSQMIIDDSEENNIPKHLNQLDTDSPKNTLITENNFNEYCMDIFKTKKNSFEDNGHEILLQSGKNNIDESPDIPVPDNNVLMKQYHILENVFKKVADMSMFKNLDGIRRKIKITFLEGNLSSKQKKLCSLNKKLDEKRESLTNKLKDFKESFTESQVDPEFIRSSLLNQIEILIDLINTTKMKISLMQEIEKEFDS